MFIHGFTFGGHPVAAAAAHANLDIFEREGISEHVRDKEGEFRGMLESLRDLPIVGDVRGAGTSRRSSWSRTRTTRDASTTRSPKGCCAASCRARSSSAGLICRADDRGDPVIQLSPPLISDTEQFEEIEAVLRKVLAEAWEKISSCESRSSAPAARSHPRSSAI